MRLDGTWVEVAKVRVAVTARVEVDVGNVFVARARGGRVVSLSIRDWVFCMSVDADADGKSHNEYSTLPYPTSSDALGKCSSARPTELRHLRVEVGSAFPPVGSSHAAKRPVFGISDHEQSGVQAVPRRRPSFSQCTQY